MQELKPTPTLTERVVERLRGDIVSGRYAIGEMLPSEGSLAVSFGVSRTVLREAIAQLKAAGLVGSRQGRGVFIIATQQPESFQMDVSRFDSRQKVIEVVELRMGVETEAAGLAAERRGDDDLVSMRSALERMKLCNAAHDLEGGVEADIDFHRAVYMATKNPHYAGFFQFLSTFLRDAIFVSRERTAYRGTRSASVQAEHEEIFEAIANRDAPSARAAARRHVRGTADRLADAPN